jgi:hypothetical protein
MNFPHISDNQRRHILCIAESYRRLTRRSLVSAEGDPVEALWSAPLAIVAHGTEPDPIFFFGNRTALTLFEMDFCAFSHLPSRLSAEPLLRDQRSRLLERVTRHGIIEDYGGVRISATGKRFRISNAAVWNVTSGSGTRVGQAAAFAEWAYVDQSE